MAVLEPKPLVLKDVELLIGDTTPDDFKKFVSQVEFTPSTSSTSWTGLGANTHTDTSTATWTCTLRYVQDWESTKSLSRYLYDNEGKTVTVKFKPKAGTAVGTPVWTAQIVISPGAVGGQVNAFAETSVTLGLNGKPTIATS